MRRHWQATFLSMLVLLACSLVAVLAASAGIAPSVQDWLKTAGADDHIAVWVFLRDKGAYADAEEQAMLQKIAAAYDADAVARRLRARPQMPFDQADLPLYKPYLDALKREGLEFRVCSKWLNAVSVVATPEQLLKIAGFPFVAEVRRVSGSARAPQPETWEATSKDMGALYQYGQAWTQLNQIQVPQLHSEGYTGAGVKVAILDTGFWLAHEVFASLNKIAEHDFINDDSVTANQPGDPAGQHDHGTMCLSLLAAKKPGTMMGAAFDAQYILAKTEDISTERPIEEDWWIAAAEWADSLGAQVISSSVGYTDWYTYADMDGHTAPITLAAERAVINGIVVVNAAGNAGASEWRYVIAPADGDSVISVGSVDSLGTRSAFSSQGPTYDGRIKPTIMAMGQANFIANTASTTSYRRGSGTSFATPMTAGAVALLLQKHPNWLPGNVIEAITATGTRATDPDTLYGWGILQASAASDYAPSGVQPPYSYSSGLRVYPNPCSVSFEVGCEPGPAGRLVRVFDVAGRLLGEVRLAPSGPTEVRLDQLLTRASPGIMFVDVPGAGRAKVLVLK